ncbi:MAG: recombination protein NinG [Burkholderiales bacterium]
MTTIPASAKAPALRPKRCVGCREPFTPVRSLQRVCGFACAVIAANKAIEKREAKAKSAERAELKKAKERHKSLSDWKREAQAAINRYRRTQDVLAGYGCISCGTHNGKQNGGHYRSVGSSAETRYMEENIHLQCERCNSYLSGNILGYRKGLIARYGLEYVEKLEGPHEAKHYTIDDLREIKRIYNEKYKEIIR